MTYTPITKDTSITLINGSTNSIVKIGAIKTNTLTNPEYTTITKSDVSIIILNNIGITVTTSNTASNDTVDVSIKCPESTTGSCTVKCYYKPSKTYTPYNILVECIKKDKYILSITPTYYFSYNTSTQLKDDVTINIEPYSLTVDYNNPSGTSPKTYSVKWRSDSEKYTTDPTAFTDDNIPFTAIKFNIYGRKSGATLSLHHPAFGIQQTWQVSISLNAQYTINLDKNNFMWVKSS